MAKKKFAPVVTPLQPTASSKDTHEGTVCIDVGDRRVHVLFYDDGGYRIRLNDTDLVLTECYLGGGQHSILGLAPR